jgi:hypothetical protein
MFMHMTPDIASRADARISAIQALMRACDFAAYWVNPDVEILGPEQPAVDSGRSETHQEGGPPTSESFYRPIEPRCQHRGDHDPSEKSQKP